MGAENSKTEGGGSYLSQQHSSSSPELPVLCHLLDRQDWRGVLSRLASHPKEASFRFEEVNLHGRSRSNVTPLHLAAALQAPPRVVDALIEASPCAARVQFINAVIAEDAEESTDKSAKPKDAAGRRRRSSLVNFLAGLKEKEGSSSDPDREEKPVTHDAATESLPSSLDDSTDAATLFLSTTSQLEASLRACHHRRSSVFDDDFDKDDVETEWKSGGARRRSSSNCPPGRRGSAAVTRSSQSSISGDSRGRRSSSGSDNNQRRRSTLLDYDSDNSESDWNVRCNRKPTQGQGQQQQPHPSLSTEDKRPCRRRSSSENSRTAPPPRQRQQQQRHISPQPQQLSTPPSMNATPCRPSVVDRPAYLRSFKSFRRTAATAAGANAVVADHASSDWLPLHVAVLCRAPPPAIRSLLLAHPWGAKIKNGMGMLPLHIVCAHVDAPLRSSIGRRSSSSSSSTLASSCSHSSSSAARVPAAAPPKGVPRSWTARELADVVTLLLRAFPESVHVCSSNVDGMTPLQYAEENIPESRIKTDVVNLLRADIGKMFPPLASSEKTGNKGQHQQMVHSFQGKTDCLNKIVTTTTTRRRTSLTSCSSSKVPKLYLLISDRRWKAAIRRVGKHPEEASIWTLLDGPGAPGISTGRTPAACPKKDPVHRLPLHKALSLNAPADVVDALIGAYPESLASKQEYGLLPLHSACHHAASYDVVESILKSHPSGARARDTFGNLPVHIACGRAAPMCVVRILLGTYPEGAKVVDGRGRSALERAVASDHPDSIDIAKLCGSVTGRAARRVSLVDCVGELPHAKKGITPQTA